MGNPEERVAVFLEEVEVTDGKGLERRAKLAFCPAGAARNPANLAQMLGVTGHDPIGVAPFTASQDDRRRLYERHDGIPGCRIRRLSGRRITGAAPGTRWPVRDR